DLSSLFVDNWCCGGRANASLLSNSLANPSPGDKGYSGRSEAPGDEYINASYGQ
ncbi:unnamed protein product, partial [marine sediment metagenome]